MATLTLKIDDDLLQKYRDQNPKVLVQHVIEATLKRFADIAADQRALVFADETRKELEILHGVPIEDPKRFVEWVRTLISANVLGMVIPLKDGQRKRLLAESKFWNQDFKKFVETRLKAVIDREWGGF